MKVSEGKPGSESIGGKIWVVKSSSVNMKVKVLFE